MKGQSGATSLVEYAAGTTTGARRVLNEDAFGVFEDHHLFVVVDGCGGTSSGEKAATRTIVTFAQPLARDLMDPLASAILTANADIYREGQTNAEWKGQGAALCAVRVSAAIVSLAHVGDCRVGRYRQGRLAWLTEDHSLVAERRKRSRK